MVRGGGGGDGWGGVGMYENIRSVAKPKRLGSQNGVKEDGGSGAETS